MGPSYIGHEATYGRFVSTKEQVYNNSNIYGSICLWYNYRSWRVRQLGSTFIGTTL